MLYDLSTLKTRVERTHKVGDERQKRWIGSTYTSLSSVLRQPQRLRSEGNIGISGLVSVIGDKGRLEAV